MAKAKSAKASKGTSKVRAKSSAKSATEKKTPRDIPGNFPYTTSPGVLRQILAKITEAERPPKFSGDFVGGVLGFTGGSAAVVPPILKRTGFLNADASPTELYSQFKSDGGRSQAALDALKKGFSELFKRNEYAHKLSDAELKDVLVSITGLTKSDPIIRAIFGTFAAIKSFIDFSKLSDLQRSDSTEENNFESVSAVQPNSGLSDVGSQRIGFVYNINIVLPITDDAKILNAIFRSVKENLLR